MPQDIVNPDGSILNDSHDPVESFERFGTRASAQLDRLVNSETADYEDLMIDAEAVAKLDDDGAFVQVTLEADFPNSYVAFYLFDTDNNDHVAAVEPFATSSGIFEWLSFLNERRCCCYIPFRGVTPENHGTHTLHVRVFERESHELLGIAAFDQELPESGPWSLVEFMMPALRLCVAVGLANGDLTAPAVGAIREACEGALGLGDESQRRIQVALKEARASVVAGGEAQIRNDAELYRRRTVVPSYERLADLLQTIAESDGPLTPQEHHVIRIVLLGYGMSESAWQGLAAERGFGPSAQHFAALELDVTATLEQAQAAFRRLVKQYHPDRFAEAPPDIRTLAEKRTIEIREAYEAIVEHLR